MFVMSRYILVQVSSGKCLAVHKLHFDRLYGIKPRDLSFIIHNFWPYRKLCIAWLHDFFVFQNWDRSHLLENLSGTETDCGMLVDDEWSFPKAFQVARLRGLNIEPVYGFSENLGRTEPALKKVVEEFKPTFDKVCILHFIYQWACKSVPSEHWFEWWVFNWSKRFILWKKVK